MLSVCVGIAGDAMSRRLLTAVISLMLLFSFALALSAQETEDEEKKKPEDRSSKWEDAIPVYTFKSARNDLFKIGPVVAEGYRGPGGSGALDLKIKLKSLIGKVSFSFFIENRIWGSPGMDGFCVPRTSLNINPITGKYYFDF